MRVGTAAVLERRLPTVVCTSRCSSRHTPDSESIPTCKRYARRSAREGSAEEQLAGWEKAAGLLPRAFSHLHAMK